MNNWRILQIETEVHAGVDGPGPFKRKNGIYQRIKTLLYILNIVNKKKLDGGLFSLFGHDFKKFKKGAEK